MYKNTPEFESYKTGDYRLVTNIYIFICIDYPIIGKLNILETCIFFFFPFKQTEPQQRMAGYSYKYIKTLLNSNTRPHIAVAQFV